MKETLMASSEMAQINKELYVGLPLMKSYDVREVLNDESAKSSRNRFLDHLKSSKYGKLKYGQQAKFQFEHQPGHINYAALEKSKQLKKVLLEIEQVFNEFFSKIIEAFLRHQRRKGLLLASIVHIKKLCEIQETIITCLQRLPDNIIKDLDMVIGNLNNAMEAWCIEINSFEREAASQNRSTNAQTLYPLADLASMQSSFESSPNTPISGSNIITYILTT
ncbi:uncharacterized protein LOC136025844 [Artemia franciscana]|uniref:uncharacterized protein LOC136025844 n=1 Tax=Artemia franciscana TaxID=6661 RepID=UPI0032D9C691